MESFLQLLQDYQYINLQRFAMIFDCVWQENVPAPVANEMVDKEKGNTITKPCLFTDLYHKIPQKISKNMAKSLSVPIAFVCLLHLANEKVCSYVDFFEFRMLQIESFFLINMKYVFFQTLKILGQSSMEDLSIAQGIQKR